MLRGNEIIFEEFIGPNSYSEIAEIEALTLFPKDLETRQRYWDARRRAGLIHRLYHYGDVHGWPQSVSKGDLDLLVNAPTPDAVVEKRTMTTIIRHGFLAGHCLRFLIRTKLHHKGDMCDIDSWKRCVPLLFTKWRMERVAGLMALFNHQPTPTTPSTLASIAETFLPVAHFWAACFDDDGNGSPIEDPECFAERMGLAEGYRRLAEESGVYDAVGLALDKVFRLLTEMETCDPDSGEVFREKIVDVDVTTPSLPALPEEILGFPRKPKK